MSSLRDRLERLYARVPVPDSQRSRFVRIGRNFSWAAGGAVLVGVLALVRTRIVTRAIPIDEYGRLLIVINLCVFCTAFVSVRVGDSLYSFYPRLNALGATGAKRGLLLVSLGICLGVGALLTFVLFAGAQTVALSAYHDPALIGPIRAYAIVPLVLSAGEFTTPILRLEDRYHVLAVWQVLGSITGLSLIALYVARVASPDLTVLAAAMAVLSMVQGLPPFALALWSSRKVLLFGSLKGAFEDLQPHAKELRDTLFQTNLLGYMKVASSPGDQFLLGLTAPPDQVALYGFARQLVTPLVTLQTSLQAAIMPEITSLYGNKPAELREMLRPYLRLAVAMGALSVVAVAVLVVPMTRVFATPQYLPAAKTAVTMAVLVALALMASPAYPVGLVGGRLGRYNLMQVVGLVVMVLYLGLSHPTAFGLAVAVLVGYLALVFGFAYPIYRSVLAATEEDGPRGEPPSAAD